MENQDIITTAQQLVAELWETKEIEAVQKDAPPCPEAVEDEVAGIERFIKQWVAENDEEALSSEIMIILKHSSGSTAVYIVGIALKVRCEQEKGCKGHNSTANLTIIRHGNGVLEVLEPVAILDRRREIMERIQSERSFTTLIIDPSNAEDLLNIIRDKAMQTKRPNEAHAGGGNGGDDDGLPPAATIEETAAPLAGGEGDEDGLPPAAVMEQAKPIVEYHRIATQGETHPGVLRRAWDRLWRR